MIAYLSGEIREKGLDFVVLDVRGVGYGVYVTADDLAELEIDKPAVLQISEYIREQAHDLYGFVSIATKNLFEQLLAVNGVGPKMALSMLSIGTPDKLKQAIADGDIKFISLASGVGKRVAERVVVDLKDKVGLFSADDATGFLQGDADNEALQALVGLGFSNSEALRALSGIDKKLPTEEKIKQALKVKA